MNWHGKEDYSTMTNQEGKNNSNLMEKYFQGPIKQLPEEEKKTLLESISNPQHFAFYLPRKQIGYFSLLLFFVITVSFVIFAFFLWSSAIYSSIMFLFFALISSVFIIISINSKLKPQNEFIALDKKYFYNLQGLSLIELVPVSLLEKIRFEIGHLEIIFKHPEKEKGYITLKYFDYPELEKGFLSSKEEFIQGKHYEIQTQNFDTEKLLNNILRNTSIKIQNRTAHGKSTWIEWAVIIGTILVIIVPVAIALIYYL